HAREAVLDARRDDQALDVDAAAREHERHAHEHAGLVVHEHRDRVSADRVGGRQGACARHQVLPVGLASLCLGGSMIMSRTAAPAGIIGNTLSSLTTSATTTHGPSS